MEKIDKHMESIEKVVDPIRRDAFKRFPFLFTLAGAIGASAVFFGVEVLITKSEYLIANPWLIILMGVVILYVTGKVYKKLG